MLQEGVCLAVSNLSCPILRLCAFGQSLLGGCDDGTVIKLQVCLTEVANPCSPFGIVSTITPVSFRLPSALDAASSRSTILSTRETLWPTGSTTFCDRTRVRILDFSIPRRATGLRLHSAFAANVDVMTVRGQRLYTGSRDNSIRAWSLKRGEPLAAFVGVVPFPSTTPCRSLALEFCWPMLQLHFPYGSYQTNVFLEMAVCDFVLANMYLRSFIIHNCPLPLPPSINERLFSIVTNSVDPNTRLSPCRSQQPNHSAHHFEISFVFGLRRWQRSGALLIFFLFKFASPY